MKGLMRAVIGLMFVVCTATSYAWVRPDPGHGGISGEYLYLLPMISESYYTQERNVGLAGQRHSNDFTFTSAYRLAGVYEFCNCFTDFQLVWTHLPKRNSSDSTNGDFFATQGLSTVVSVVSNGQSSIDLEFYSVDGLLGFWGYHSKYVGFVFRTGIHYVNLNFKENIQYQQGTAFLENLSNTWGIGPEIMFALSYTPPICSNLFERSADLSLCLNCKGALLASKYDVRTDFRTVGLELFSNSFANNDKRWDLISFWDLRLGINYSMSLTCVTAYFEVGYEMLYYRNAIDRIDFYVQGSAPDDPDTYGLSFDLYSDACFQGPYVALGFTF